MDTQALKAFMAVAHHQSFSTAADNLYLTQSAVSKRVKQLEEQLGSTLFDRHNRTISLTEAGQALLPRAREILDLVADTELQIENMSNTVGGHLSLATSHQIGLHRLPPVLQEYVRAFPAVDLNLEFMGSERAYHAIRLRQVELALTTLDEADKLADDIEATPLWEDRMICVCAPHHRLASLQHITFDDLADESAILPEPDTITYRVVAEAFAQRNLMLKAPMPTNFLETIKMMVSVGMGWSLLPESMVDRTLYQLRWPGHPPSRQLGLIQLRHRTLSNAAHAMINLLNR